MLNFIELFAGIGGFRRGLEPLGFNCVGWVEMDKFARQSYEAIWPKARDEWNARDITSVTDESLREFAGSVGGVDLIAGGFPCQAFSVAGKRRGFEDTRGTLFFEVARFAMVLRPKHLLLENVVGLLSHDDGETFYTILCALDELGYDTEWQVFNATEVGIPQNRERVFIHSVRRGSGRKVFPLGFDDKQTAAELECVGMLDVKGQENIRRVYAPTGVAPTLTTMAGGNREPKIIDDQGRTKKQLSELDIVPTLRAQSHGNEPKVKVESGLYHSRGFEVRKDDISHCIKGAEGGSSKNFIKVSAVNDCIREEKQQNGRRVKEPDEPMFTLTAQDRHGVAINGPVGVVRKGYGEDAEFSKRDISLCIDANYWKGLDAHQARTGVAQGTRIRKLTPLECWRLMGREDWEHEASKRDGVSDSQRYKQAGNSLVPQIVAEIGKAILAL